MKNEIKDIFSDPEYGVLRKIASRLPAFVKNDNTDTYDVIPLKSWAYIEKTANGGYKKYFPIHNAAHSVMSFEYLKENKSVMTKEAYDSTKKRIVNAMSNFGVAKFAVERNDLTDETIEEPVSIGAEAKDWKKFILDGIRVEEPRTVNVAINKFRMYHSYMLPGDRYYVSKEILKAADAGNIRITRGSLLYRYKLLDEMKLNKVASEVVKLRFKYYEDDIKKMAKMLIDEIDNIPSLSVAERIVDMDKLAGITDLYNRGLPDPYLNVLGKKRFSKTMIKISKPIMSKLSSVFNEEFVNMAKDDPIKAYGSLGKYGQSKFREIVRDIEYYG